MAISDFSYKLCPLDTDIDTSCRCVTSCAWWDNERKQCAMMTLTFALASIANTCTKEKANESI